MFQSLDLLVVICSQTIYSKLFLFDLYITDRKLYSYFCKFQIYLRFFGMFKLVTAYLICCLKRSISSSIKRPRNNPVLLNKKD